MSNFDINISGGATIRLLTAGKYCDKDIVITAEDPGEGGVQLPELTNPATPANMEYGYQLIDENGNIVEGSLWRGGGYGVKKEYSPSSGRVTLTAEVGEPFILDDGFVIGSVYVGDVEPNLKPENIVNNVTIAGVMGNYVGGVKLPELTTPGGAEHLREGYQMIDANGNLVDGGLPDVTPVVTVSVDSGGLITASATTDKEGVVSAGNVNRTRQLPTLAKSMVTVDGLNMEIPGGYYVANNVAVKADVNTVDAATPTLTLNKSTGLITGTVNQSPGYIENASSKKATLELTTQEGVVATPGTATQVIVPAGVFTVGKIGVAGDANLVPENIAAGVSIFGVAGTHEGGVTLPVLSDPAGENDVREGKEYIDADGVKQYGRLKMDGVFTPDWSTYVPIEVQYDSDDRYLVMKNTDGIGGGMETVNVTFTIYGNGTIYYMGTDGIATLTSPYEQTVEVVKNSPVMIIYDGSTALVIQDGSGFTNHYENAWQYSGHSCCVLSFYEDGNVLYAES